MKNNMSCIVRDELILIKSRARLVPLCFRFRYFCRCCCCCIRSNTTTTRREVRFVIIACPTSRLRCVSQHVHKDNKTKGTCASHMAVPQRRSDATWIASSQPTTRPCRRNMQPRGGGRWIDRSIRRWAPLFRVSVTRSGSASVSGLGDGKFGGSPHSSRERTNRGVVAHDPTRYVRPTTSRKKEEITVTECLLPTLVVDNHPHITCMPKERARITIGHSHTLLRIAQQKGFITLLPISRAEDLK